jgi:putative transposase
MVRTFKYRLYPTAEQERVLSGTLEGLRSLYNAGLQQRREAYSRQGKFLSRYDQHKDLTGIKEICPELAEIPAQVLRDPLDRLDLAFKGFFRRVKAGQAPGFPRFKGRGQFRSFTYPQAGEGKGARVLDDGHSLRLFGIGVVQVKRHRPYRGTIKQVKIALGQDERWHVLFVCEDVAAQALPESAQDVGIDLGLTVFATLSDGMEIANPRYMRRAERKVKFHQRRLARAQSKSNRRKKIKRDLARAHAKVRRTRRDFHFKTAATIVNRFGAIYYEDLNVVGMIGKNGSGMRRSISDAGWGQFIAILTDKAGSAGRVIVAVNPAGTSQLCSACGLKVPKSLSDREHICPCGFRAGRDLNAALNVKLLGRSGRTSLHEYWRARSENS